MSGRITNAYWQIIGKSVIGANHLRQGKPCQDAILWGSVDDAAVLSIADGHGSERSPHSDEGARIAVEVLTEMLSDFYAKNGPALDRFSLTFRQFGKEHFQQTLVRRWKDEIKKRVICRGEQWDENSLVQYGSTVLGVLVSPRFLVFLQLGDGDILLVNKEGLVYRPLRRDERLFANETTSLCTDKAWAEVQVVFHPLIGEPPVLVLISTDGYANSFTNEEEFQKAATDYLQLIREEGIESVESHMEEWLTESSAKGSGDDITVGILFHKDALRLPRNEIPANNAVTEKAISDDSLPTQTVNPPPSHETREQESSDTEERDQ